MYCVATPPLPLSVVVVVNDGCRVIQVHFGMRRAHVVYGGRSAGSSQADGSLIRLLCARLSQKVVFVGIFTRHDVHLQIFLSEKGNNIEKTGIPNLPQFCRGMHQIQPSTMPPSLPSDSTTKGNVHLPTISSPIHLLTVHLQCLMPTRGRWRSRIRNYDRAS